LALVDQITQGLSKVVSRLQAIEQRPALKSTPAQYLAAILAAGRDLMSQGVGRLDRASDAFEHEQRNLAGVIGTVRGKRKQWEWLGITAAAALTAGLVLSPFAARLLPFGWDAAVAATILHADRWHAGQALMKANDPTGWATLAAEINVAEANHDALSTCREAAARTKKEQRCSIGVSPP
jgi:hypothetical protein